MSPRDGGWPGSGGRSFGAWVVVGGRGGGGGRGWRCRPAGCREWQHGEPGEGFGELAGPGPGFSDAEVEAAKDRLLDKRGEECRALIGEPGLQPIPGGPSAVVVEGLDDCR